VTRNPEIAARIRLMRIHGIRQDAFSRYTATTPSWFYEVVAAGFKYNLTDIAAAIGVQQLRKIDAFLARRQQLAATYTRALRDLPLQLPADAVAGSGNRHAWHLYVVRLQPDAGISRDALIARLCEQGIGTSVHFIPLHRHPVWRSTCQRADADFPAAEAAFAAMLSLPLYTKMSDADQQRVITALNDVFAGNVV
jgi:dTDP-4-amino-4,6-dideoxygalactose transaminase